MVASGGRAQQYECERKQEKLPTAREREGGAGQTPQDRTPCRLSTSQVPSTAASHTSLA
jgi:hypothetical protein